MLAEATKLPCWGNNTLDLGLICNAINMREANHFQMPYEGKDELLCAWDGEEAHAQMSHSSGPSRNTSGHDFLSAK